ncbi:MAG: 3-deoxy-7-phosphoheptulonate synthase [Deltaproteobacteria bacterium]|nr:3-deoxy-7-phosphoheptulonate synthase [Deltaproteobacteria bacterium]
MPRKKPQLERVREAIDGLNDQLLDLLNQRTALVEEIRAFKVEHGMDLYDPVREARQIQSLMMKNRGPMSNAMVEHVFKEIFRASLSQQMRKGTDQAPLVLERSGTPRIVDVGGVPIGGGKPTIIAGPCAVESEDYLEQVAEAFARLGLKFIRGGAFKPRTSPYTFQGLGMPGVDLLRKVASRHDLRVVTEITDACLLPQFSDRVDVIQVGARNMYNYDLLKKLGNAGRPVLLKRHFAATLDEFFQAAEYLLSSGNRRVILCERGIRTFENATRNTLDISAVCLIKEYTDLPVVVDVSHAAGRKDLLVPLSRAVLAAGADGIMIEVHPNPAVAMSDGSQQLSLGDFERYLEGIASFL